MMMTLRILGLTLLPVICFAAPPKQIQRAVVCDSSALPVPAQELLTAKFSQWRPKLVSDMDADDQQLWLTAADGKKCPGIVAGHFEFGEQTSYAVLLVPKSKPTEGYKVGVLTKNVASEDYVWKLIDHAATQAYSGLIISKAPPGRYSDLEGNKSIQIKLDGIKVEWLEKGAVLFFWSAGKYQRIVVSD
jgi:hypothetical protein